MKLRDLLKGLGIIRFSGLWETNITGISYDSRKVEKGDLFIAMQGEKVDGHKFIENAIARGAAAVVFDSDLPEAVLSQAVVGWIRVMDSRESLSCIANNFFMDPSRELRVLGVTGTNGKTTTTYILKSILEAWGRKVGLIGTIQYMIGTETVNSTYTTPEALEFQGLLRRMRDEGCSHVVTEVSSHALSQHRVDGTVFSCGIFTNLTRDHLDFHKTMEAYFGAKERLFRELLDGQAASVINTDDAWGRKLAGPLKGKVLTFGLENSTMFRAADIRSSFEGLRFRIVTGEKAYEVSSPLTGLPNVYNILSAAAAAVSEGVPWDKIVEGISKAGIIPGRFEKVDAGQGFLAVVDYAHTEDALERLIYTARGLTEGKVITVFGCGGDRDKGKRPIMGSIATRLSDFVIITSDNPRNEDPNNIIMDIETGAVSKNYLVVPDRKEAIQKAVLLAGNQDVLLLAGKGHEGYQEICGKRFEFSDREVLRETITQLIRNK